MDTKTVRQKIIDSSVFVFVFGWALFGGAGLTALSGLIGLGAWIVNVAALALNNPPDFVRTGCLFGATTLFLLAFNLPFGIITLEGGNDDESQRQMNAVLRLSLICMLTTGLGACLILLGSGFGLAAALAVPIINLIFFVWALKICGPWWRS